MSAEQTLAESCLGWLPGNGPGRVAAGLFTRPAAPLPLAQNAAPYAPPPPPNPAPAGSPLARAIDDLTNGRDAFRVTGANVLRLVARLEAAGLSPERADRLAALIWGATE